MSPEVRTLGTVTDLDGIEVRVGVDHDAVTVSTGGRFYALHPDQWYRFADLLQQAWQTACANAAVLAAEAED